MGLETRTPNERNPAAVGVAMAYLGGFVVLSVSPLVVWLSRFEFAGRAMKGVSALFIHHLFHPKREEMLGVVIAWTVTCVVAVFSFEVITSFWHSSWKLAEQAKFSAIKVGVIFSRAFPHCLLPLFAFAFLSWQPPLMVWAKARWSVAVLADESSRSALACAITLFPYLGTAVILWSAIVPLRLLMCGQEIRFLKNRLDDQYAPLYLLLDFYDPYSPGMTVEILTGMGLEDKLFRDPKKKTIRRWPFIVIGASLLSIGYVATHSLDRPRRDTQVAIDTLHSSWGERWLTKFLLTLLESPVQSTRDRTLFALTYYGDRGKAALPGVMHRFTVENNLDRSEYVAAMDAIDEKWPKQPEAKMMVPALCEFLSDVSWVDPYWEPGQVDRFPEATISDVGQRDVMLKEKIPVTANPRWFFGSYLLNEFRAGRLHRRALESLDQIDPSWKDSAACRRTIARLRANWNPDDPGFKLPWRNQLANVLLEEIDPTWIRDRAALNPKPPLPTFRNGGPLQ